MHFLNKQETDILLEFTTSVRQNIFYEEKEDKDVELSIQSIITNTPQPSVSSLGPLTFVEEANKLYKDSIEKYVDLFRIIKYQVEDRKERIDHL